MSKEVHSNSPTIGFTVGDPRGIGAEIIATVLSQSATANFQAIIYGNKNCFGAMAGLDMPGEKISGKPNSPIKIDFREIAPNATFEDCNSDAFKAGKIASESLKTALQDWKEQKIDLLVTGPIDKSVMPPEFGGNGHTEFIAAQFPGKTSLMFLCSEALRVGLVTNHVPIKEVASMIQKEIIVKKLQVIHQSLKTDFDVQNGKIAVLALNPHAGEGGKMGDEEKREIEPAIMEAKALGIPAEGPFPADTFFGREKGSTFSAVLAMYHDQGLIPFKQNHFFDGLNFTAGLPLIRTSPDHGPALDIAGKGMASPESLKAAIKMGLRIWKNHQKRKSQAQKD